MRDIPLDEFADEGAKADTSGDDGMAESADREGPPDREDSKTTPELPTPTATWTPDGSACAACGTVVDRRWTDEGTLVCLSCKSW